MKTRLQKIISDRGYCSRRRAEVFIARGDVKVNGVVVKELGSSFEDDVKIVIHNNELKQTSKKVYLLFNKPRDVITTMFDPKGRKCVGNYFEKYSPRVFPVGRLDYDVSGLLLMTNDGDLANAIAHPRYEYRKTYQALCDGYVSEKQIKKLLTGVTILEDYKTKAIEAEVVKYNEKYNESIITLTISEGKKHHVKEMLKAVDIYLKNLKRIKIEFLGDKDLNPGSYRVLDENEVEKLYKKYRQYNEKVGE